MTAISVASAQADGPDGESGSHCGPFFCEVEVDVPGSGGGSGGAPASGGTSGGSGGGGARPATEPVCTYKKLDPQPIAGSLDWEGHEPDDGAVYEERCTYDNGLTEFTNVRNMWAATPPAAVAVDPATLARQAVDRMLLRGPQIGITPKPGGKGVVGMPVYLWTERGPETYGPNVASASAGGITVTATAQVSRIVWNMGDGKSVICTTPGTPYKAEYGKQPSPDCGHRYTAPSSTTGIGTYHVNATSTWTIGWQATTGQSGQLTETRQSAVDVTVAEVQVLN
ncbi:ATP/GTP-binding protein [Streptomyces sp. CB02261]|uniref:ATP/GTP-binding protein n=1 Tax=Streptomyces sp. CB02261 TaxID=1703940 RepID=UPI000B2AC51B|nr:ATP/GTP-binding protein [Streptomyces sp. CB02261]